MCVIVKKTNNEMPETLFLHKVLMRLEDYSCAKHIKLRRLIEDRLEYLTKVKK